MTGDPVRQRIIDNAIELFNTHGCKGVTMDQLAMHMHISKRTIYEKFDSKEALIQECLAKVYRDVGMEKIERFVDTDEPFLASLFVIRYATSNNMRYSRLLHDAEFYYPELTQKQLKKIGDKVKNILLKLFEEANANGDLRNGVDIHQAINMIEYYVKQNNFSFHPSDTSFPDRLNEVCFTYMRGLLSIPAIERYDRNEERFKKTMYNFES